MQIEIDFADIVSQQCKRYNRTHHSECYQEIVEHSFALLNCLPDSIMVDALVDIAERAGIAVALRESLTKEEP